MFLPSLYLLFQNYGLKKFVRNIQNFLFLYIYRTQSSHWIRLGSITERSIDYDRKWSPQFEDNPPIRTCLIFVPKQVLKFWGILKMANFCQEVLRWPGSYTGFFTVLGHCQISRKHNRIIFVVMRFSKLSRDNLHRIVFLSFNMCH